MDFYTSQNIPKNWRGGNTPKFILWGHPYSDTKIRQRHYKARKLQANIPDEYRCKHLKQNISKPNSIIYKKDHTPWPSGIYPGMQGFFNIRKSISVIHHINKRKDKNHMITSIDAKSIWQNSTYTHDKNFIAQGTILNIL